MRNVSNQVNVFVRHHFIWILLITTNVKALANDFHVELIPSAHQVIHHSVCARQALKAKIQFWDAAFKIFVHVSYNKFDSIVLIIILASFTYGTFLYFIQQRNHAHTEPTVLQTAEDTLVSAQQVKVAIHTKQDVLFKIPVTLKTIAKPILSALIIWLVCVKLVLAHVRIYVAAPMHTASQKNMLVGVVVVSDLLKLSAVNVFRVSRQPTKIKIKKEERKLY